MQQQQQEQQDRGRKTGSPNLDGSSNGNNFPSSSYCRPVLESNDSTATSISTLSASSSAQNRRQPGSLSPSRNYNLASNNQASSSSTPYSTTLIHGNEPPTPNSFLRSPPTAQVPIPHLQQPVFSHPQQQMEQQRRQEQQMQQQQQQQQRYDPSEDPYGTYTSSANYVDGRDYSNGGVGPYSGGGGTYGTFNTEDIEDISFNRHQPAPQTFQPMQIPEPEEKKVFASLEEVHESNGQQKEEVVGEQTAFISKVRSVFSSILFDLRTSQLTFSLSMFFSTSSALASAIPSCEFRLLDHLRERPTSRSPRVVSKENCDGKSETDFPSLLFASLSSFFQEYARYLKWSKDGQAFILTNSNEFAIKGQFFVSLPCVLSPPSPHLS